MESALEASGLQFGPLDNTLVMYYERLLCNIFLVLMLLLVKKIGAHISGSREAGSASLFTLFTMPCFFITTIFWGIYDSIYMTAVLLGIYLIFRNRSRDWAIAILLFGLAVSIKSIVLVLITPIILYRLKSIPKLIASFVALFVPMAVEAAIFLPSPTFRERILFPQGFFLDYLNATQISLGNNGGYTSVYLVLYLLLCFFAYTTAYDEKRPEKLIYIAFATMGGYFILCAWSNQQWTLLMLPFFALLLAGADRERRGQFYALNAVLSVGIIGKVIGLYADFSEQCFASGLLAKIVLNPDILITPSDEASRFSSSAEVYFTRILYSSDRIVIFSTVTAAVLLCALIYLNPFKHKPDYSKNLFSANNETKREKLFMYLYFALGLSAYLLPVMLWVIVNHR